MDHALSESWRFEYRPLAGFICDGDAHGVELTRGVDGGPVTRARCLNVEHYYAANCSGGRFVPRSKADHTAECLSDDVVRVTISPYGDWHVRATVDYRVLPECVIEATFRFAFEANYTAFEAFISNYFHEPDEPYLCLGGQWEQPRLGDLEHRFWARGRRDAADLGDGRIAEFLTEARGDYEAPIDERFYDLPILVTPIRQTGWSIVHAVEGDVCPSLSANRTWHAHDFSLVGHDVSAGQTVTCRAWMAYVKLDRPEQAVDLYHRLVDSPKE